MSVSLARQTTVVAEGASWMAKSKGVPSGLVVVVLVWVLRTLLPSTSSRDRPLGVPGEGFTGGVIDEGGTQIPLSTSEIDEF